MSPHDYDGPGPTVESVVSDSTDPADVPVPDDCADLDLDDDDVWQT